MNMSASAFLRNGVWISLPLFCISAALLGLCIRNVIRVVRRAYIVSVPLLEQQEIEFAEAGGVVLCGEGPRFTTRFAKLAYELSADDGTPIKGRTAWFHASTSGASRVRMELKRYRIPKPGRYVLRIQGLGTVRADNAEHRIVFMKPHLAQSMGYVVGIVLAGGLLIGSIVFFGLSLASKGASA